MNDRARRPKGANDTSLASLDRIDATVLDQPRSVAEHVDQTDCCIVGAGPGGAFLSLLLARAGISVLLLEAHRDFEREYRGEGLQPPTLDILEQLGLLEQFLRLPHSRVPRMVLRTPDGPVPFLDPGKVSARHPYLVYVSQARLLEFVVAEAERSPNFHLVRGARVDQLIEDHGSIGGVYYGQNRTRYAVRAQLVVGGDGRFSQTRLLAGLTGPTRGDRRHALVSASTLAGGCADPSWHLRRLARRIGLAFPKGAYQQVRSSGLDTVRQTLGELMPWVADRLGCLQEWGQTAVLTVESSRVRCWSRPGLLLIGYAAHVMSPAGAVGINMAIADAVAAAHIIGPRLQRGQLHLADLRAVQRQREWHTRVVQWFQATLEEQNWAAGRGSRMSLTASVVAAIPALRELRNRVFVCGGLWPEQLPRQCRVRETM